MRQNAHQHKPARKKRPPSAWRAALLVLVVLAIVSTLGTASIFYLRSLERLSNINVVDKPSFSSSHLKGLCTIDVEYSSLFAAEDKAVRSQITWNDEWFFENSTQFNSELAHTAAVFSSLANSESAYYQKHSNATPVIEETFGKLGFDWVDTSSYQQRSEVIDEVAGLFENNTNVSAYSIAKKDIRSSTGTIKRLYVVVIRGSYGSEWISNTEFENNKLAYAADDDAHGGYQQAAEELVNKLETLSECDDTGQAPSLDGEKAEAVQSETALLICGHSRGGALANLIASYVDAGLISGFPADAQNTYAYTFASPRVTRSEQASSSMYHNIFNVINPSDMVPQLPLEAWGYERYGVDVALPGLGDSHFDEYFAQMKERYQELLGKETASDPEDKLRIARFTADLASRLQEAEDMSTLFGVGQLLYLTLMQLDVPRLLASHYTSTYVAWIEALPASYFAAYE